MQTATYFQQPMAMKQLNPVDPLRSSVTQLMIRALNVPCSAAAQTYMQMVPSTSRFQLALDVFLPLLDSSGDVSGLRSEVSEHGFTHCGTAFPANPGVIYLVFALCTASHLDQSIPICAAYDVHEGERFGDCYSYRRERHPERAVGLGAVENPERRRQ